MKSLFRMVPLMLFAMVVMLVGCRHAHLPAAADVVYAERWWNVLTPEQMVAALYGTEANDAQAAAAKMMYDDLDGVTKAKVNAAAADIYGHGGYDSVGAWWDSLDCRQMRVAVGDGNTADPSSPFCVMYAELNEPELTRVRLVGTALLNLNDPAN